MTTGALHPVNEARGSFSPGGRGTLPGSPLYPKIVLHLSAPHYGGKTFMIVARNSSRQNRFIQSARLNGQPLNRWWIRQKEVVQGGQLELELSPTPNREWARTCPSPD
ncbi:MAG: glycoside hydrolase domain-containing protein [Verrucomicrobiota bacterium]